MRRSLPFLPMVIAGVLTDLGFQRVRFPHLRFPDSALATAMFLVLIIWPAEISIALASVVVAAVGLRHLARRNGHPMLNPAAAGITLGVVLFGLSTNWHISVSPPEYWLVLVLGLLNVVRAPRTWRLPAFFFAAYVPVVMGLSALAGGVDLIGRLATTGALSATPVFFGLFLVPEPQTAPPSPRSMALFSLLVGLTAAAFPALFNEIPAIGGMGVLALFLALFAGNGLALWLPQARFRRGPSFGSAGPARRRAMTPGGAAPPRSSRAAGAPQPAVRSALPAEC